MDEIFNPTTANMVLNAQQNYVNAMRRDYEQGVQDTKDFIKEYGEFTSPFAKDNETYQDLTIGGASKLFDGLRAQGIDPLRSAEGRSAIQRYIMSRPYGELSKIKASAETGREYQKMRAKLIAEGKYSPEFEDYWLKKQGLGGNFENWDTTKMGQWTIESPLEYQDLNKETTHWFDNSQPLFKGKKGAYRVYSLDMNDLMNIAQPKLQGYVNTPTGAYRLQQFKDSISSANPNLSDEQVTNQAMDALKHAVAEANREWLRPEKYEIDQVDLARMEHSWRMQEAAQKQQGSTGGNTGGIVQYADRLNYAMNQNFIGRTLSGSNWIKSSRQIQNYWAKQVNAAKKSGNKNAIKYATAHYNWWKGSEKWDLNKLADNGIISVDKFGNVVPTSRFINAYSYSNSTNTQAGVPLMQAASNLYNAYTNPISGANKAEMDMWRNEFAGTSELKSMPGTPNKYRHVQLNDRTLRYAPIRQANVTGSRAYTYNSIQRKFDRWLRGNSSGTGYQVLGNISVANIPRRGRSGTDLDIQGGVSITSDQFKQFCNSIGVTSAQDITNTAKQLGIGIKNYVKKSGDDSSPKNLSSTYYVIPMIRTAPNDDFNSWRTRNTLMNKSDFGASNAYAEEPNAEAQAIMIE